MSTRLFCRLFVLIILLLFPVVSQSQSAGTHSIASEADLLSTLLSLKSGDQQAALALLSEHRELVTPHLVDSMLQAIRISFAFHDSARSLFVCDVAKTAALQLQDKTLLGRVIYRRARINFEHDN